MPTSNSAGIELSAIKGAAEILGLVAEDLARVEAIFAAQLTSDIPIIRDVGRHILESGGKRLRPALHLLCSRAVGGDDPKRIVLAAVFELIHTATLVHDDVIDDAPTRRGRPSLNARLGNTITVLMGDYLYLKSVILTLENEDLDILRAISSVTAKMIEGELLQVVKNGDLSMGVEDYEDIVRRKTAYLFAVCCQTAGMLARVPEEVSEALYRYGLNLGMAFQLVDDLLDFTSDERVLGKPVLSDFREGKVTYPVLHLLAQAGGGRRRSLEERLRGVLASGDFGTFPREEIVRLVRDAGGIDATRARASTYGRTALEALHALPASEARHALEALPEYVLYRET
ncbi:MAG: polyprenyl synthetase family protein [Acidobacteriota bacterium]